MATGNQDGIRIRFTIAVYCVAIMLAGMSTAARADDTPNESADRVISKKLIDDVTGQIEKFCKARNVSTVQVLSFNGTVGTRPTADVKREWLDNLKERGIGMRDIDSTRLSGRIVTQLSGDNSIILLKCTLSDNRGGEIRTFRVRKVVSTQSLNVESRIVAQVTRQ